MSNDGGRGMSRRDFLREVTAGALVAAGMGSGAGWAESQAGGASGKTPSGVEGEIDLAQVRTQATSAAAKLVEAEGRNSLRATFECVPNAELWLLPPGEGWDFSDRVSIALAIENVGERPAALRGRLNESKWVDGFVVLEPGQTDILEIILKRSSKSYDSYIQQYQGGKAYPGILGLPGGHVTLWDEADPTRISRIAIISVDAVGPTTVVIRSVRGVGDYVQPPEGEIDPALMPFVDRYGQYKHKEWPGKIHSDRDLAAQRQREDEDLVAHEGPSGWDQYGGWATGPKLEATGHFRVEKHDGRWWLVDPEGCLFWSHGIDCVSLHASTRVVGREAYFEELDDRFRVGEHYDFARANLLRKYGDLWEPTAIERAHRRLRSWGMNTLGNWSHESVYSLRRTPYVVPIHYRSPELGRFPYRDMDLFRQVLRDRLAREKGRTADDPWCIGYFVDNELRWPEEGQAALAEAYYGTCRDEVRRAAPNKLYLGSRLHEHNDPLGGTEDTVRAAARHCDVVSMNRYRFSPGDLRMPEGVDRPILIGEWHFGALDRGMLHPGLRSVGSQEQRAAAYRHYVRIALRHPHIVGTHWFQYLDRVVSGGGYDGGNYQVGFVDVCDTLYWETIGACREVGYDIYKVRAGG